MMGVDRLAGRGRPRRHPTTENGERTMRPGTTIAIALLLVMIVGAMLIQLLIAR